MPGRDRERKRRAVTVIGPAEQVSDCEADDRECGDRQNRVVAELRENPMPGEIQDGQAERHQQHDCDDSERVRDLLRESRGQVSDDEPRNEGQQD